MTLILCCAGMNTRFHNAGFDCPKYLLPWGETTVITEIINQLVASHSPKDVLLLINKRDSYFKDKLQKAIPLALLGRTFIEEIGDTFGQAHTAAIGAELCNRLHMGDDSPLLIHNADTILYNRHKYPFFKDGIDAYIDCFTATSPKYCYVKADDQGYVHDIVEKEVVSHLASSGLYIFKNIETYLHHYGNTIGNPSREFSREVYISDILKHMLLKNCKIGVIKDKLPSDTLVLGSPEEYGLALVEKMLNDRKS